MANFIEKEEPITVHVLPLRGMVAFPRIPVSLEISNPKSVRICRQANENNDFLLLLTQKDPAVEEPEENDFYSVGTILKINQFLQLPEGGAKILGDCICRASVQSLYVCARGITAEAICKTADADEEDGLHGAAVMHIIRKACEQFEQYMPKVSPELKMAVRLMKTPGTLADFVACNYLIQDANKQAVLDEFDPLRRAERLLLAMEQEGKLLETEREIHKRVRAQIDENQRRYYLQEQLRQIQDELDEHEDPEEPDDEIREYHQRIRAAALPAEVEEKLMKEVRKLAKMPYASAESSVMRSYLDTCLEIPWNEATEDCDDPQAAKAILDREHYGLEKIKQRIVEFLSVRKLNPDLKNQILCLVGPPGTGKTSVVASLARAMHRKYVRVSLGGVRDEADIRGHRKTYVGSMPGRLIHALIQAKVKNPLILLDEIDKLTHDSHGDPASALLEVLDAEQNKTFRDHFVELPFDLSQCVFIATANTLDTVPRPLIDRMEIMELQIYSRHEKLAIAKRHLIPKQRVRHGLSGNALRFTEDAILEIIDYYTLEAGVRNLEREIAAICRKVAAEIVAGAYTRKTVKASDIATYLEERKILPDPIYDTDEVGVVNGLAYTEMGGDMLRVEVSAMPGTGKIELTGSLGDVMKESAHIACSYLRANAAALGVDGEFYKNRDLHIHVPEGAVPKDGPSAGVTIVTALASELSGKPVRRDVAMTGEVTLRGRVLPIGGLKEKTMAAYRAGVRTVFIPKENEKDLAHIDPVVRSSLTFVPCTRVEEVLAGAICR